MVNLDNECVKYPLLILIFLTSAVLALLVKGVAAAPGAWHHVQDEMWSHTTSSSGGSSGSCISWVILLLALFIVFAACHEFGYRRPRERRERKSDPNSEDGPQNPSAD